MAERFCTRIHNKASSLPSSHEWSNLWQRCHGTPFQSAEWLTTWLAVFSPPELRIVEVRHRAELVGIAPLCSFGVTPTPLVCVGAYTSDYLDWLVDPRFPDEVLGSVFETARESDLAGREINLTDLPSHSELLRVTLPSEVRVVERENCSICPVIRIPAGATDSRMVIPARQRRNLRTAQHRASNAGTVQMVSASEETLNELLDALFRLHERRWKQEGQPGVLSYESAPRFHRMAAQSLLKSGMLRMYGMRLNGSIIGVIYGFAAHGTVYCYLQGFDPEFVRLSAGAQTLGHLIDVSVRSGEVAIDLLRGEEPYKYGWGAQDEQTYRLGLWVRSASPNIEQRQPSAVA